MIAALETVLIVLLVMDIVTITFIAVIERYDFEKFLAWSVITIILPFIGAIGYFVIGQKDLLYRLYSEKRMKEADIEGTFITDTGFSGLDRLDGVSTSTYEDIQLFSDGNGMLTSLKKDLEEAKESILMEYYFIFNDEVGDSVIESLCKKGKEGLDVKVICDAFGSRKLTKETIGMMAESGVGFTFINKLTVPSFGPRKNNCDHRKLVIIDHRITYCGGLNLSIDYIGEGHLGYWRDSATRIVGSVSEDAEKRFMMTWAYATDSEIPKMKDWNPPSGKKVSLVYGGPDTRPNPVIQHYIEMIRSAKESIIIETPYFSNIGLVREVRDAARSGVKVKVIIPGIPDHWFTLWNNIHAAKNILGSGAEFLLYNKGFMHSKMVVVDGRLSSIGSANFDDRTAYYNFDANLMFDSKDVADSMMAMIEEDLAHCKKFDPSDYSGIICIIKTCICAVVRPLA